MDLMCLYHSLIVDQICKSGCFVSGTALSDFNIDVYIYIYINMCRHINAITYPGTSVQEVCTASKGGTQIHIDCNTFDVFVSLSQSRFCGGPMY